MSGNVQIKYADIFTGASDMIVLPCSTDGGVTQIVFNKLQHHGISLPPSEIDLGDVIYQPFN